MAENRTKITVNIGRDLATGRRRFSNKESSHTHTPCMIWSQGQGKMQLMQMVSGPCADSSFEELVLKTETAVHVHVRCVHVLTGIKTAHQNGLSFFLSQASDTQ